MDTAFLEVWYSVIGDNFTSRQNGEAAALQVSLMSPLQPKRSLFVKLPIDEVGRRDSARLQLLREAMELFTILSVVNNRAFTKFFDEYLNIQPTDANSTFYYPQWRLCLVGTLASTDPAAMQSPVSWGTLLGFPRDRSSYSPDFRAAYEKLEALGVEEASKKNIRGCFNTYWKCDFKDSRIEGGDQIEKPADTVGLLLAGFEKLFTIRVPPIFQFHASGNGTKLFEVWQNEQSPTTPCESVVASPRRTATFTPELTAALTWTRIQSLYLSLYSKDVDLMDDPQTVVNVGFMLNALLCGRSLDVVLRNSSTCLPPTMQVEYNDLTVSCDVPDTLFIATCSAVAEMTLETHLHCFDMSSVSEGKWLWFAFALCCGASSMLVPNVEIARSTLTKRDLVAMEAVLRTKYPRPVSRQHLVSPPQYGFVDLSAGTKLQLSSSLNGGSLICVVSRACRCRALFDPAIDANNVEMVIPGYGACKAALGGSIRFTPDSENSIIATKRVSGSLKLHFVKVEDTALLMDLLLLLTRGLRLLSLREDKKDRKDLDLTALSVACPDLRTLRTSKFNVVVSAHDEFLRRWPIQDMNISATRSISDLTLCLSDRSLRMSKELVKLEVASSKDEAFSPDAIVKLKAYDGEFLPVVKEKFPIQSKTAMLSVVASCMEWVDIAKDLNAGTLGGVAGIVAGHPLDTIKVQLQTNGESGAGVLRTLGRVLRSDGTAGLFRGVLSPVLSNAPINAVIFGVQGQMVRALKQDDRPLTHFQHFIAGSSAGLVQVVFAAPSEHVKIQLQTGAMGQEHRSLAAGRTIVRKFGVATLFRGWEICLLRDVPSFGAYFWCYEVTKRALTQGKSENETEWKLMTAGGLAGMLSWALCMPLDVVKSRVQGQTLGGKQLSMVEIARTGMKQEGLGFLFKGFGATMMRAFPVSAVTFLVYEKALQLME